MIIRNYCCLIVIYQWCCFLWNMVCHMFWILKQVDGMDAFAVKQACKFAKEHALKNGPIVRKLISHLHHSMFLYFLCQAF